MLRGVSAEAGEQDEGGETAGDMAALSRRVVKQILSEEAGPEGSVAVSYLEKNILEEEQQVLRL